MEASKRNNYYFIEASNGPEIGKDYPQSIAMTTDVNPDSPIGVYKLMEFTEKLPDFKPKFGRVILAPYAILTDVISCVYFNQFLGILINKRTLDILLNHKLTTYRYFPIEAIYKGDIYHYYWFHIISEDNELVDFSKSMHKIDSFGDKVKDIKISSYKDFYKKREITDKIYLIKFDVLYLFNNKIKYDLFKIGIGLPNLIVSSKLKKSLQENDITGLTFRQLPSWIHLG